MALTAAIKFTQGPNTDVFGRAVFGTLTDGAVSCTSQVTGATGTPSYTWELVDAPAGSALTPGIFSTSAGGAFGVPDLRGGYTIALTVEDDVETVTVLLLFGIKEASGRFIPGFKAPDTAHTFGGNLRGWSKYLEEWLHYIDAIPVPGIVIAGFGANTSLVETGQSVVAPSFTASYTGPAVSTAVMTNDANGESRDVHLTPTSFTSAQTYVKSTPNQSVTFTLNATGTAGPAAVPRTASITWGQKNFFGVSSTPANTEAFIESLTAQLTTSRNSGFSVNATAGQKIYFACPTRYGAPTFTVGGFVGGFILRATGISVTNAQGFTETYDLYESVNAGLGTTAVTVS